MNISRLLPQDTRLCELAAGWALLLLSLLIAVGAANLVDGVNVSGLLDRQSSPFWVVCLACLGFLQIAAVMAYPQLEVLRVIMAWVSGTTWMWIALAANMGHTDPPDVAALTLGFANLYAFVVNALLTRRVWTN